MSWDFGQKQISASENLRYKEIYSILKSRLLMTSNFHQKTQEQEFSKLMICQQLDWKIKWK